MIYQPKDKLFYDARRVSVFLAGTIDNGNSSNWQLKACELLEPLDVNIYNPRNDEWDSTMEPIMENPAFAKQVQWEMDAMNVSDIILMNFLPNSKSPITLLELGLFADSGKIVLVCPDGYYRKGNVDYVADINAIPIYKTMANAMEYMQFRVNQIKNLIKHR